MKEFRTLFLLFPVLFQSCIVLNSGNVSSGPIINANDKYVDIATGESQSNMLLFIGGQFSNKLILEAKTDLYKNRPLRRGEYYSNFTCDFSKKIILGIFLSTKVTVSADILMTDEVADKQRQVAGKDSTIKGSGESFKNAVGLYQPRSFFVNQVDSFIIGERIFFKNNLNYELYEITAINGSDVSIKPLHGTGSTIVISQEFILFSTKKPLNNFSVGERVRWVPALVGSEGTIVATSLSSVLLWTEDGYFKKRVSKIRKL